MRPVVIRLLLLILFLGFLLPSAWADSRTPDLLSATRDLKALFPNMRIDSVQSAPVDGLLEVVSGDRIIYYAPTSKHVLIGDIFSRDKKNLSKIRMTEIMAARIDKLSLDQGLKIGDGPNQVIEITDPDCAYCRKGSQFFSNRNDVTRYVFLLPLAMHPQSMAKSEYILSAENPQAAYEDVFSGKFDRKPLPPYKESGWLERQKKAIEPLGVNSTPSYWVNGNYISGSNLQIISELLKPQAGPVPEAEKTPAGLNKAGE